VNDCFKPFIAAFEGELDGSLFDIFKFTVVFDDQNFVAAFRVFARLDQQVETMIGCVVRNPFEAILYVAHTEKPI
jgi:hypothetical protein